MMDLSLARSCRIRDMIDRVGDKWSMLIIRTLELSPGQRRRFSELRREMTGISPRMLSSALRALERDGIVSRHLFAEVPPRVEYALTDFGREFLVPLRGLFDWLEVRWDEILSARERFDLDHPSDSAPGQHGRRS